MTDREAANTLYSICEYLGLSPQMLKYRVLSGWILMPPPTVNPPQTGVNLLGQNRAIPSSMEAHPERMLGETKLRTLLGELDGPGGVHHD